MPRQHRRLLSSAVFLLDFKLLEHKGISCMRVGNKLHMPFGSRIDVNRIVQLMNWTQDTT